MPLCQKSQTLRPHFPTLTHTHTKTSLAPILTHNLSRKKIQFPGTIISLRTEKKSNKNKGKKRGQSRFVKRSKKADAEVATAVKSELYRKLRQWMKDYYKVVEMAFREQPQLKEKVGIVVPYLR